MCLLDLFRVREVHNTLNTQHSQIPKPQFIKLRDPDCSLAPLTSNTPRGTTTRSQLLRLFAHLVLKHAANGAIRGGRLVKEEREISILVCLVSHGCTTTRFVSSVSFFLSLVFQASNDRDHENCTCSVAIFTTKGHEECPKKNKQHNLSEQTK